MAMIDTHIHVWDLHQVEYSWLKGDTSILNRTYSLAELEEDRQQAGITQGVLVQAANNEEDTDWMLRVAAASSWITGIVGWLPLINPDETARILEEKYRHQPLLKGIRHLIHNEADPRWLLQPAVLESLQLLAQYDLAYDVVGVIPAHISTALKVAEKIPGLRMVFDHLNQPPIARGELYGQWGELMREASRHPNFFVKISGLGTTAGKGDAWVTAGLEPYIRYVLELFGEDRCFCGGDWPVSLLAGSYERIWSAYRECIGKIAGTTAQQKIFSTNAERFYRLPAVR